MVEFLCKIQLYHSVSGQVNSEQWQTKYFSPQSPSAGGWLVTYCHCHLPAATQCLQIVVPSDWDQWTVANWAQYVAPDIVSVIATECWLVLQTIVKTDGSSAALMLISHIAPCDAWWTICPVSSSFSHKLGNLSSRIYFCDRTAFLWFKMNGIAVMFI